MSQRILIVIPTLKLGGGAEKNAVLLGEQLIKKGKKIFYFTFYDITPKYTYSGIYYSINENIGAPLFVKLKKIIKRAHKIAKFCKKNNINTIISFANNASFSVILSKLLFKNKIKIIVSVRNSILHETLFYKALIFWFYQKVDVVVPISISMEDQLINICKIKNTKMIYNMHDVKGYCDDALHRTPLLVNNFIKDSFVFINIGRLTKQKGHWFLIRAFKKVVEKHRKAKLIIMGEGELRKKLEALIKQLSLDDNILLPGNFKNIFPILSHGDCFVLSSLNEGFPNSVLEALSLSLPVISTDCPTGPKEILAPELPISAKIEYPFWGKFGVLTSPFKRKYVFKTIMESPLDDEENMLSDLMIQILEGKSRSTIPFYEHGLLRAKEFDINKNFKKWEQIL